jgi:MFS superfamily sulfate permease-like transporter
VWVVAVTLALVASLETLLSQEALKKLRPQNPPPSPNREMVAQGVGNLLSGVLGAMPITAVIVRSSVNVSNGAQSKLSIFIHGVLLLICGLWFSGLLTLIPLASLAAVLLYTGYKLATPRLFIEQFRQGRRSTSRSSPPSAGLSPSACWRGSGLVLPPRWRSASGAAIATRCSWRATMTTTCCASSRI